jgi:uncharacterized protein (TIGR02246 family)
MDGKKVLIVTVISFALGLETQASMPFGRLMPLHYGPDDCRTITVAKSQRVRLSPSNANGLSDEEQIKNVVREKSQCWNAHDIIGYMDLFWRSSSLTAIVNGEQVVGWDKLMDAYRSGYADPKKMGSVALERIAVQRLDPELFLATSWFAVHLEAGDFPSADSMIMRRFPEGWKIVSVHSGLLHR